MVSSKATQTGGKIAAFVARYSNKSSGAGYKNGIESFLRSVNNLQKNDKDGNKITHDFETLFDNYLTDIHAEKRKTSEDVMAFAEYLGKVSKSNQSVRQVLTYAVKVLRAHGVNVDKDFVQDIKRETKGGAETIAKVPRNDDICNALRGASVRDRAIIMTLCSSGLRIGELLSLEEKDIALDETPTRITIRASKAKNKHPRFTYCSDEAREAIKAWQKVRVEYLAESAKHNKNLLTITVSKKGKVVSTAPVKTDTDLLFPVSDSQINSSWETCLKKAGLYMRDGETNRNIYRLHSLRKFFDTRLSNTAMPDKLVQFFLGHLTELGKTYYIPSEEYAAAEYLKFQDVLTVCTNEKTKTKINSLEKKTVELVEVTTELKADKQDQRDSIEYLRSQISSFEKKFESQQTAIDALINIVKNSKDFKEEMARRESEKIIASLEPSEGASE